MHWFEEVRMGSALPTEDKDMLQSTFCRSQDFMFCFVFLSCSTIATNLQTTHFVFQK